ncbi:MULTISPECIES: hypothetical protein [unclassified Microcoleus]|uniref:hypothetical protein n=1 Tax=unclassified Microcoleus TaxID=2642155 RepID=UPI002FD140BE
MNHVAGILDAGIVNNEVTLGLSPPAGASRFPVARQSQNPRDGVFWVWAFLEQEPRKKL